jgi:protein-S-isoprenylcysteine O-methyltransferase Ste14
VTWRHVTVDLAWPRWAAVVILIASTVFTLWARVTLGTMWSSSAVERSDHRLRTDGPYGVTRHPIYTGLVGMLVGSSLASGFGRWTGVMAVGIAYLLVKMHVEERLLMEVFPVDYPRYREQVPQLLPGLRRVHVRRRS